MPRKTEDSGAQESEAVGEVWRPIYGYGDAYWVSDQGRVFNSRGVEKKQRPCPIGGYMRVDLWKRNKRKTRWVHRLVARAFLGPCPKKQEVHHRDFVVTNNTLENLMYLSAAINSNLREEKSTDPDYLPYLLECGCVLGESGEFEQMSFADWKRLKTEVPF